MEGNVKVNYIKASYLIGATLLLILIGFFLGDYESNLTLISINIIFIGGMALLLRKQHLFAKYLPIILLALYVIEGFSFVSTKITLPSLILFLLQVALIIWAIVILFKKRRIS